MPALDLCAEGWYISGEIDDVNWRSPERRELLFDYAGGLAGDLRSLNPGMTIAISAFSQAQSSPDGFRQFRDEFFQRTAIDTVLFQDGVGVKKLDLREVPLYAEALQNAARQNNRRVRAVVELFQQMAGREVFAWRDHRTQGRSIAPGCRTGPGGSLPFITLVR